MVRGEPVSKTRTERLTIEFSDGFRRTENRAAQRMLRPEAARENLVKQIFGIVQVHLDFFEDDLALFSYIIGVEFCQQNNTRDHEKGQGQFLEKTLGVKTIFLFEIEGLNH